MTSMSEGETVLSEEEEENEDDFLFPSSSRTPRC